MFYALSLLTVTSSFVSGNLRTYSSQNPSLCKNICSVHSTVSTFSFFNLFKCMNNSLICAWKVYWQIHFWVSKLIPENLKKTIISKTTSLRRVKLLTFFSASWSDGCPGYRVGRYPGVYGSGWVFTGMCTGAPGWVAGVYWGTRVGADCEGFGARGVRTGLRCSTCRLH